MLSSKKPNLQLVRFLERLMLTKRFGLFLLGQDIRAFVSCLSLALTVMAQHPWRMRGVVVLRSKGIHCGNAREGNCREVVETFFFANQRLTLRLAKSLYLLWDGR